MLNKKNIILIVTLLAVLFTSVSICGVSADTAAGVSPVMSVDYISLSFKDSIYIKYAAYTDGEDATLLIWNGEQEEYTVGTHIAEVTSETTQTIGGKVYSIFDYTGVTAKQMADVFYARVYVQIDGNDYYSPVCKYSVLNYAYSILGKTGTASTNENLKTLMANMLAYGASAQTYLNYKTDRLATMDFYQIKVVGGELTDTTDRGFYRPDDQVTMTAPAVDAAGTPFAGWQNSSGITVSTEPTFKATVGTKNETYTATYGAVVKTYSVTFVDYDGKVLKTETVESGKAATAPADPSRAGYIFTGWDTEFSNITGDLVVTAVYEEESTEPCFYGSTVTAAAGSTNVEFTISVKNNPGILGMLLSIEYDEDILTLTNTSNGEATGNLSYQKPSKMVSGCNFVWYGSETGDVIDGSVLNLEFSVAADAPAGTYPIVITYSDGDTFDAEYNTISATVENGSIVVG